MERGTGGNRILDGDASIPDLMRVIHEGIYELKDWAEDDDSLRLDLGRLTVKTERVRSGKISVEVSADLKKGG